MRVIVVMLFTAWWPSSGWAASTVEVEGHVKSLTAGVITLESKIARTELKADLLTEADQKTLREQLAKNGHVKVHVVPEAIVSQKMIDKAAK